jgi:threonine dehydrogenase-like Zn-dependent dehydrogenase
MLRAGPSLALLSPSRRVLSARYQSSSPRQIKDILVIGCGLMGSGISQASAAAGIKVTMCDVTTEQTERGVGLIRDSLKRVARKTHPDDPAKQKEMIENVMENVKTSTKPAEAVLKADLVIEAIVENLGMKQRLFKSLDESAPGHTICGCAEEGMNRFRGLWRAWERGLEFGASRSRGFEFVGLIRSRILIGARSSCLRIAIRALARFRTAERDLLSCWTFSSTCSDNNLSRLASSHIKHLLSPHLRYRFLGLEPSVISIRWFVSDKTDEREFGNRF